MKERISVGDLVEVDLKTGVGPFQGRVLATSLVPETHEFIWYKVEPSESGNMPGLFWYKDTEVKKVEAKNG